MSNVDLSAMQIALEKIKVEIQKTSSGPALTDQKLKLKVIEELLKEQMPYENTHSSAR